MDLQTPLAQADRIYKMYARRLEKLGITKLGDFLLHIPHRYDDFSLITPIAKSQAGEVVTIQGELLQIKNDYTRKGKTLQRGKVQDESGVLDIMWFNQPFITKSLLPGDKVSLSGRVEKQGNKMLLIAPSFEVLNSDGTSIHTGRLVPIYPETAGVSSKWLRRQIYKLLQYTPEEYLPESTRKQLGLLELPAALQQIHFPSTFEDAQKARERLSFDELLLLQLAAKKRKKDWQEKQKGKNFQVRDFQKDIEKFIANLPFSLTFAQKRSVEEIFADLQKDKPMNRMLEGDVGSGKTIVGGIAMYLTHLNGLQSVLMAPTQILAQQHYDTIKKLLEPLGIKVGLQTGNSKSQEVTDILIGTHAVLSEKITLDRLGLIIIDEQQRFGVAQRSLLRDKGTNPHLLTMTATPIPRTVALTMYGDLELSILDEMPKGRKKVKTWLVPSLKRNDAYKWIEKQVKKGNQVFIICPFIEESENMTTVKAAKVEFERLQKTIFPKLSLGMLHGKMKAKEKENVLADFKNKKYDILVATPIVEVGIDIPNATVILIEASDRFGLAQLHQLRGRVGRSDTQSYCLLFTDNQNPQTTQRLKALETIYSGPALAELDMQMRGAGDLYGTMQHGRKFLKIASFGDLGIIEKAKKESQVLFQKLSEYPLLAKKVEEVTIPQVSPD